MRSTIIMLTALFLAFAFASPAAGAQEEKKSGEKAMNTYKVQEGFQVQTTCPVMGGKITRDSYVDYEGQRVYFCCPGCKEDFLKDPDKYFEKAAKDKVMFENVQTTCPGTDKPIEKKFFTYYKGRGIYFCSGDSMEKFKADPGKYLMMMREREMKGRGMEMKGEGMEKMEKMEKGHEHGHGQDSAKGGENGTCAQAKGCAAGETGCARGKGH